MSLFVTESKFYKNFLKLTLLIALQNIIVIGVNLSDNLMLGGYSENALSGAALANQIQFMVSMLVMGASQAVVIMASRLWGANQHDSIKKVTSIGIVVSVTISVLMFLVVTFFSTACLSLLTNDKSIILEGSSYLKIISYSYFFFAVTNVLLASLRSMEIVRVGLLVSLSTLIINVCLNYILIYGNFGFPRMGIEGSAIGTLIARVIECFIVIFFIYKNRIDIGFDCSIFKGPNKQIIKEYIKISSPILISGFSWAGSMAAQTGILGHMGTAAIAANSVATTIFQLVTVVAYASSSSTSIIMGKAVGEGDIIKIKTYSRSIQVLYLCLGIMTAFVLFFTKDFVINLYTISDDAKDLAVQFMMILSITVIGTAYEMPALSGIIQSGGDTKFVMYNDFIFMWLLVLPASFLSAFVFGASPVLTFVFLKCDQILKCFVAVIKVNRFKWIPVLEGNNLKGLQQNVDA